MGGDAEEIVVLAGLERAEEELLGTCSGWTMTSAAMRAYFGERECACL